ncbi:hypothetical protein DM860_010479 [Cuscuta australis]|uniref:GTD-binding domain-containing protein n=1 Tax=Cuscuta australis TaxID=267555 RepID=A0A328E5P3_9ASTE|nr:hypothetical protein DM860_010479 [Cuscuta australis]
MAAARCFDCRGSYSKIDGSVSGTCFSSAKQESDECEDSVFPVPGLALPLTARIDIGNECAALREMVSNQQRSIDDLNTELDAERYASSSAADEAMAMILRLEREKAEVQMEFTQFKRFTEEKMIHDQQELFLLEDLLYKREQAIHALTCEVQMYKHRMMSLGFTESEVEEEIEKERIRFSSNNSVSETSNGQLEVPLYDYPPLKCLDENQVYFEADNEVVDVEKYAFGETPRTRDHFLDLESRINHLERSPTISHPDGDQFYKNNVLEKVIVGQSPRRPRHLKKFSSDSAGSFWVTNNYDPITESPKFGGSFRKMEFPQKEEFSNLRKVENASEVEDCMSDRVYTIDSIHLGAGTYNNNNNNKASVGTCEDYINTPRDSLIYTNTEDVDIKKLYARLHALEADRESMRQALISMSTDKSQVVLLKEIAQHLCKDMSRPERMLTRKPSPVRSFSIMSLFKWMFSSVLWRRKSRRSKYMFGTAGNSAGLLMLLDKGPRVGQWICIFSTQV